MYFSEHKCRYVVRQQIVVIYLTNAAEYYIIQASLDLDYDARFLSLTSKTGSFRRAYR